MSRPGGYRRGRCRRCDAVHAVDNLGQVWRHDHPALIGQPMTREGRPVCGGSGRPAAEGSITTARTVRWRPTRPRTRCPVCDQGAALTPNGLVWRHRARVGRGACPGSGTTPVTAGDLAEEEEGSSP